MEAGKRTINDIFNGNRRLVIPFFQRTYVWKEEQWSRLLEDMEMISVTEREYFFGSIILKSIQTSSGSTVGDERTIVDGQQRMTTIAIFLKVLGLKTGKGISVDRMFLLDDDSLAIQHSRGDVEAFEKVMRLNTLVEIDPGKSNIIKAYEYFRVNIDETKLDLQKVKNKAQFVGIDLHYDEDEQQIFDTINSLGVKLTTGELLKNYFFTKNAIGDYKKFWEPAFEKDDDCRSFWDKEVISGRLRRNNIELFLSAFLQVVVHSSKKVKVEDKIVYRRYDKLFVNYKHYISNYVINGCTSESEKQEVLTNFIKLLTSYAAKYRDNFDPSILDAEVTSESGIERLMVYIYGLDGTVLIPYLMYVLTNVTDSEEQKKIFEYLESYLMRRFICKGNNKNYSDLFTENLIGNGINSFEALKNYIAGKDKWSSLSMPSNHDLRKAVHEEKYTNVRAHGILYMLESKIRPVGIHSTSLNGYKSYSLEHLMPKNWRSKWGSAKDADERDFKILTIGNLAIITSSLNSSIRDSEWIRKLNGNGSKKGLRTYAAGLVTMEYVLSSNQWDEDKIYDRADWIADKAIGCWPSYAPEGEEISDESGDVVDSLTLSSAVAVKKKPKFSINGSDFFSLARFVRVFVREYIKKYPEVSFEELCKVFHPNLLESGYRFKGLLCKVEVWQAWENENKSKRYYTSYADSIYNTKDGVEFYVNTQWTLKSVKNIVEIAEREGFTITSDVSDLYPNT